MARRSVTFWGTAKSRQGAKFHPGVTKPKTRQPPREEVASWRDADRARLLKQLKKLRRARPSAALTWYAEELNRWVASKPLVREPRSTGSPLGKRPLQVPTLTPALIKALLEPPESKPSVPPRQPLTEQGTRALAEGLTAEHERRVAGLAKRPGGAARPKQQAAAQARGGPASWPAVYRRRIQRLLRDHLATEATASHKRLRDLANEFHCQHGKNFDISGNITRAHIGELLDSKRWPE